MNSNYYRRRSILEWLSLSLLVTGVWLHITPLCADEISREKEITNSLNMILVRIDGALAAFWRGDDPMPMTRSTEGGKTWSMHETKLPGIHVGRRASVLRLASDHLLLLIPGGAEVIGQRGALAALSLDGGRSWAHERTVKDVRAFTSLTQVPNGIIYAGGSKFYCAAFNEAWLREGKSLAAALVKQ